MGARLRRRRRELGLTRKAAAQGMKVSEEALCKWEQETCLPGDRFFPTIIAFLGCEPWPEPKTLPERLQAARLARGLSVKRAAHLVGIDEATFARAERQGVRSKQVRSVLERFVDGAFDSA